MTGKKDPLESLFGGEVNHYNRKTGAIAKTALKHGFFEFQQEELE